MRRRDVLIGAIAGLAGASAARADVPRAFGPDMWPPMASRAAFVSWMTANRGEDPTLLGRRFDRYEQLLSIGDLWTAADKRAFLMAPREEFVLPKDREQAYAGHYLDIGFGVTITPPGVVGRMTSALGIRGGDKVLEIGTGSGYQAAVLAKLCRRVFTIERHRALLREAEKRFAELKLHNITTRFGDGSKGWPEQQPFDRIIATAAAPAVPQVLIDSLAEGGILVAPVGEERRDQQLLRIRRTPDGIVTEDLGPVRFVPLVEGLPRAKPATPRV